MLSGCSTHTRQTLAYSSAAQYFAYAGEAHVYVFNVQDSAFRIDAVIPFCEKAQGSLTQEDSQVIALHDSFGGVGISCLEF